MLTECPECKKEVSSEALTCPHCGHPLKVTTERISAAGLRKPPIFLILSIVALVLALTKPRILAFFLMILGCSVVSLLRKEKGRWGAAAVLLLGIGIWVLTEIALSTSTTGVVKAEEFKADELDRAIRVVQVGFEGSDRADLVSRAEIAGFLQQLAKLHGSDTTQASEAEATLSRVPYLNSHEFRQANAILGDFAALTNDRIPVAAMKLASLLMDPGRGAQEFQDAYGSLTPVESGSIRYLQGNGQEARALQELLNALQRSTKGLSGDGTTSK
jgi:hypothetical protein